MRKQFQLSFIVWNRAHVCLNTYNLEMDKTSEFSPSEQLRVWETQKQQLLETLRMVDANIKNLKRLIHLQQEAKVEEDQVDESGCADADEPGSDKSQGKRTHIFQCVNHKDAVTKEDVIKFFFFFSHFNRSFWWTFRADSEKKKAQTNHEHVPEQET